jgi:hypothetical protein
VQDNAAFIKHVRKKAKVPEPSTPMCTTTSNEHQEILIRVTQSATNSPLNSPHEKSTRNGEGTDHDIAGAQLLVVRLNGKHGFLKRKSERNEARTER